MTDFKARGEIASIIAKTLLPRIECSDAIAHQPPGSCGFRTGEWTVLFDGAPKRIFMSIPHAADNQYDLARHHAALAISWEMLQSAGWQWPPTNIARLYKSQVALRATIRSEPDLLSIAKRWIALDGGTWNVERHAREKAELLKDTAAAIAKASGSEG